MINTSEEKSRTRTAKEAEARTKRRAEQAVIVSGLQGLLEADEQLLGFSRGLIAGGLRGKLTVGFEALFAPDVNIGLTERRVVLQHVQPESGKPNEILPHSFPLSELHSVAFSDIETFGADPAGRLNLRMFNEQHFRLRFRGVENVQNAQTMADVFASLTSTRPKARTSPTQSVCPHCDQVLDRVSRFCPYCGQAIESAAAPTDSPETVNTLAGVPSPDMSAAADAEARDHGADTSHFEANGSDSGGQDASVSDNVSGETSTQMHERPVRPWAEAAPAVETVAEQAPAEMPTEGHETPEVHEDAHGAETEGDRPE